MEWCKHRQKEIFFTQKSETERGLQKLDMHDPCVNDSQDHE